MNTENFYTKRTQVNAHSQYGGEFSADIGLSVAALIALEPLSLWTNYNSQQNIGRSPTQKMCLVLLKTDLLKAVVKHKKTT